jgi:TolB-like protein
MAGGVTIWSIAPRNVSSSPSTAVFAPPPHSVAVLPFHDYSTCHCRTALADALTDNLTTGASRIPGSVVIARESSDEFRDKSAPAVEIGRALNVHYLLEGNIQTNDNTLLVNAQLIDTARGNQTWHEMFTVQGQRLGEAEDVIRRQLAGVLGVQTTSDEEDASAHEHGIDPEALNLFYRARSVLDRSETLAAMNEAQGLLQQALNRQPGFVEAAAELAWLMVRKNDKIDDPAENATELQDARRLDTAALRLSPRAPLAIAAQGILLVKDHQSEPARASLAAALEAEPDCVQLRESLISSLDHLGQYQMEVNTIQEFLRIDPLSVRIRLQYFRLGVAYVMLDRPHDALDWLSRSTAGESGVTDAFGWGRGEWTSIFRTAALQMSGDHEAARNELARHNRSWPNRTTGEVGALFTKAQASLPSFGWLMDALVKAGMPMVADEHEDFGLIPVSTPQEHTSFDPTPIRVPGLQTIDTAKLLALIDSDPRPLIVNLGTGAVTAPGTVANCAFDWEVASDVDRCVQQLKSDRTHAIVVVMGRSPFDWNGYNGALALARAGVTRVTWYRGGEQSWAAAGAPFTDMRP